MLKNKRPRTFLKIQSKKDFDLIVSYNKRARDKEEIRRHYQIIKDEWYIICEINDFANTYYKTNAETWDILLTIKH